MVFSTLVMWKLNVRASLLVGLSLIRVFVDALPWLWRVTVLSSRIRVKQLQRILPIMAKVMNYTSPASNGRCKKGSGLGPLAWAAMFMLS
jgi:hypothetical protein